MYELFNPLNVIDQFLPSRPAHEVSLTMRQQISQRFRRLESLLRVWQAEV